MNEALIKELIKYKLSMACAVLNSLPPDAADKIRKLGSTVLEGLNEACREIEEKPAAKSKNAEKLEDIPIE
jgi:hypothetical protein